MAPYLVVSALIGGTGVYCQGLHDSSAVQLSRPGGETRRAPGGSRECRRRSRALSDLTLRGYGNRYVES